MINKTTILGLPLSTDFSIADVCNLLERKNECRLIAFINPAAWAMARRQPDYTSALEAMTLVLPDGYGVSVALKILNNQKAERISFDFCSLAEPFFKKAIENKLSIMLVGGEPAIDERVHDKLSTQYKDINIIATTHGFGNVAPKISLVMEKNPDIVIAAMGAPRQEQYLVSLRDAGFKGLAITCGGFFDQYLAAHPYYPEWIDKWNLRFAYRLYKEPKRLWRRYLCDYTYFIWLCVKALYKKFIPAAPPPKP